MPLQIEFLIDPLTTFLIMSLATFRLARLLTRDYIFEPLRNKIWKKFPPTTQFGYLFTCMWCMSFWSASLLVICYTIMNAVTLVFACILAFSAIAGLLASRLDD